MIQPVPAPRTPSIATTSRSVASAKGFVLSLAAVRGDGASSDKGDAEPSTTAVDGKTGQDGADDGTDLPAGTLPVDPRLLWLVAPIVAAAEPSTTAKPATAGISAAPAAGPSDSGVAGAAAPDGSAPTRASDSDASASSGPAARPSPTQALSALAATISIPTIGNAAPVTVPDTASLFATTTAAPQTRPVAAPSSAQGVAPQPITTMAAAAPFVPAATIAAPSATPMASATMVPPAPAPTSATAAIVPAIADAAPVPASSTATPADAGTPTTQATAASAATPAYAGAPTTQVTASPATPADAGAPTPQATAATTATDPRAAAAGPLPIALPDPSRPATATPALQAFAGAMRAGWKQDEGRGKDDDTATLPLVGGTTPPLETVRHAVAATGATQDRTLDTRRDDWPATMIDHIERLRDDADAASSRIRVTPDALGTIDLSVKRDGDTLHVHFNAEQDATRTLLADAQPQLAAIAQSRGLRLGDANVGGGDGGTQQRTPDRPVPTIPIPAAAGPTTAAATDDIRIA